MGDQKLKDCPFCGGEAELVEEHDHAWVRHNGCPADMGGFESALDAVTAWNRRALSDQVTGQGEESGQ